MAHTFFNARTEKVAKDGLIIMDLFTEVQRYEISGEVPFQNTVPAKVKHLFYKATTAPIPPTGATYFHRFASAAHSHVRTRHRDGLTEASGPPASKD